MFLRGTFAVRTSLLESYVPDTTYYKGAYFRIISLHSNVNTVYIVHRNSREWLTPSCVTHLVTPIFRYGSTKLKG